MWSFTVIVVTSQGLQERRIMAERFDREIIERFDRDSFNFMRHGPARKNVIRIGLAIMALILLSSCRRSGPLRLGSAVCT